MKAYLVITGTVFGLITLAHIWRFCAEGSRLVSDPFFIILTIVAAALCFWAVSLFRRLSRS